MKLSDEVYYQSTETELLGLLHANDKGLTSQEAQIRLKETGPNSLKAPQRSSDWEILFNQLKNPITLILIASSILSFFLGEQSDALIIILILLISALLGFFQERSASNAVNKLLALVSVSARVIREGKEEDIPMAQTVLGDIVLLNAGDLVPGDCRLLEASHLFANEAPLTGETFPTEKKCGCLKGKMRIAERSNMLFMGTHVVSGTGKAVIVRTGTDTELGHISEHLRHLKPDTEFEKGIHRFGYLLMEITTLLVLLIFSVNIYLHKPVLDSFLFSLAIAVGLTPQLLPAIISINLSKGASRMALQRVIVKRLSSIENLGSMDILCSDKTGTLTEGNLGIYKSVNYLGKDDENVYSLARLNAFFQSAFTNPIDQAILQHANASTEGFKKLDELPYDFVRKCLSVLVSGPWGIRILTKGSFEAVMAKCAWVEKEDGSKVPASEVQEMISQEYHSYAGDGYRVLAIAYKPLGPDILRIDKEDETELVFLGMLLFSDPPKADVQSTLKELKALGISLKIITGDSVMVADHLSRQVGLENPVVVSGKQLMQMSTEALAQQAPGIHVFAAVEPNQKESILLALKKAGHVVGFVGDGINDAPALHIADVGISVHGAVDVAKEAADIVLLGKDLKVLINGVKEGRRTFANTLKYIFMASSANFGNMFSMAGSSIFLPFLPLLPKQVLITNLLTDIPEMTIASDQVDQDRIMNPGRMNIGFIRRFMIVFGLISSLFDYLTFGLLIYGLKAGQKEFRTGWLVESVVSAALIVLLVRTAHPFYKSRPGKYLLLSSLAIIILVLVLPRTPLADILGLCALPLRFYAYLALIIFAYMAAVEIAKKIFYRKIKLNPVPIPGSTQLR